MKERKKEIEMREIVYFNGFVDNETYGTDEDDGLEILPDYTYFVKDDTGEIYREGGDVILQRILEASQKGEQEFSNVQREDGAYWLIPKKYPDRTHFDVILRERGKTKNIKMPSLPYELWAEQKGEDILLTIASYSLTVTVREKTMLQPNWFPVNAREASDYDWECRFAEEHNDRELWLGDKKLAYMGSYKKQDELKKVSFGYISPDFFNVYLDGQHVMEVFWESDRIIRIGFPCGHAFSGSRKSDEGKEIICRSREDLVVDLVTGERNSDKKEFIYRHGE